MFNEIYTSVKLGQVIQNGWHEEARREAPLLWLLRWRRTPASTQEKNAPIEMSAKEISAKAA